MPKMPCHISDGPDFEDPIPGLDDIDEDAAYEFVKQQKIDDAEDLIQTLADIARTQVWISVEDKLPDEYKNVLCLNWDDTMSVDCLSERCTGRPTDYGHTPTSICLPEGVTHWVPLPETP